MQVFQRDMLRNVKINGMGYRVIGTINNTHIRSTAYGLQIKVYSYYTATSLKIFVHRSKV